MHAENQQIKECIDMRACAYLNWYKKFDKITLESICVPLPEKIVTYLLDEIIILPKECYPAEQTDSVVTTCSPIVTSNCTLFNDDEDDANEDNIEQPEFLEFSQLLVNAISDLGGAAFIKTNWHSPKDAFWITAGQTMCCKDISDVYQLLKASGICKEDLICHSLPIFDNAIDTDDSDCSQSGNCSAPVTNQFLVFKRWREIHPGTEFRCFVQNKKIVGISPRDWPQYHEYICLQKKNIVNDIVTMYREHIKPEFPLYDYIFDVVRDDKDSVYLLDFSPFGEKFSDPLAFEWNELLDDEYIIDTNEEEDDPEFRYLSSDCGIQPSKRNNYGIPEDVIEMFRATSIPADAGSSVENPSPPNTLDDLINNRLENIFRNQENQDLDSEP